MAVLKDLLSASLFKDIRFWILFFLLIRLYGITNPPLETGHNWRQTTVTMAARNFYETDSGILYPRIDIAGEKTGITGMEFPVLNYMITLTARVFGYEHWYGRLINLLVSSLGLWFFFLLVRRYFQEKTAFHATIILAVSIWFQFSRKIMPDTFAMSFIIAGIYYGSLYLEESNRRKSLLFLIASAACVLAGTMSKLPAAFLLVIFLLWWPGKSVPLHRKLSLYGLLALCMIPVAWWYFRWVPHLVQSYGFEHFFMGKSISKGAAEIASHMDQTLAKFYDVALKFTGFAAFLAGLYLAVKQKSRLLLWVAGLSFMAFLVIMLKAGFTFYHHNYYIIPFVPVMALLAGFATSSIQKSSWAYAALFIVSVEGIANQWHDFRIPDKNRFLLSLEKDLDAVSTKNDLLLINSGNYPTPMYFAHRKGWLDWNRNMAGRHYLDSLKKLGLKNVLILKNTFGKDTVLETGTEIKNNEHYRLYRLD